MPDNDKDPQEFASVLITHAKGIAHDEASKKMQEAVAAVKLTGEAATVTVTLKFTPVKKIPNALKMETVVTAKIPKDAPTSMWFADDANGLHRNDPNQREFDYQNTDSKTQASGKDN